MEESTRKSLGDYSSIICIKTIVTGLEDIMGIPAARGNLVLAGRKRGKTIVTDLGLSQSSLPLQDVTNALANALGKDGTKLCSIEKIEMNEASYLVYLKDTICSAGEEPGSARQLTFTMGAIQGALEEVTGNRMTSKQIGSVLRGDDFDIVELTVR